MSQARLLIMAMMLCAVCTHGVLSSRSLNPSQATQVKHDDDNPLENTIGLLNILQTAVTDDILDLQQLHKIRRALQQAVDNSTSVNNTTPASSSDNSTSSGSGASGNSTSVDTTAPVPSSGNSTSTNSTTPGSDNSPSAPDNTNGPSNSSSDAASSRTAQALRIMASFALDYATITATPAARAAFLGSVTNALATNLYALSPSLLTDPNTSGVCYSCVKATDILPGTLTVAYTVLLPNSASSAAVTGLQSAAASMSAASLFAGSEYSTQVLSFTVSVQQASSSPGLSQSAKLGLGLGLGLGIGLVVVPALALTALHVKRQSQQKIAIPPV